MNWIEKALDELGFVGRGRSRHRPRNAEHLYGGRYPFVQTADVKHANLYITTYEQTYSDAGLAQSKLWQYSTSSASSPFKTSGSAPLVTCCCRG